MEFEHFALTRDLFYFAALLFGAGLGSILNWFRRRSTVRFRNVTVTVGLFFFSGSLAVLTLAIIYSNWKILNEPSLYFPAGIVAALLTLAFRFPKAVGFPLIFVSGVFVVWISFTCLRFPVIDNLSQGRVMRDRTGLVLVRLVSPGGTGSETVLSCQPGTEAIEFRALSFFLPKALPLVGGARRGVIAEVSTNQGVYVDPRIGEFFSPDRPLPGANEKFQKAWERIISFQETLERLETVTVLPGAGLNIFFNGSVLSFR